MPQLSVEEYATALRSIGKPGGRQREFLRKHAESPGRASTMTKLAEAADYKNYRPVNLLYGKLAAQVAADRGVEPSIWLLMDGAEPKTPYPTRIGCLLCIRTSRLRSARRAGFDSTRHLTSHRK